VLVPTEQTQTFEEALFEYRTSRGLTQEELAREVGVASITMSRYETGKSKGVQSERVARLLEKMTGVAPPRPARVLKRAAARRRERTTAKLREARLRVQEAEGRALAHEAQARRDRGAEPGTGK
jgi:transcriptional regulator with XRE-family HTH domain